MGLCRGPDDQRETSGTAFSDSAISHQKETAPPLPQCGSGGLGFVRELLTEAQSGGPDHFNHFGHFGNGHNAHAGAGLVEEDGAVGESEQGPIAAGADVGTGGELGTALADQDASRGDKLGAECLDAETLADAVAPVA